MMDELNDEERAALDRLAASFVPPADLEARVVTTLRQQKLLASSPFSRRLGLTLIRVAAALLIFLAGVACQRWLLPSFSKAAIDSRPRYVLLLISRSDLVLTPEVEAQRVEEYSHWARQLAQVGDLEVGEKLADARQLVGPQPADSDAAERVAGFFIVRAAGPEEAQRIALSCPHLRHGGRIELRRIEPT